MACLSRWLAVLVFMVATPLVRAQRMLDQTGPLVTPLTARSVDEISRTLGLDADQRALARSLYQGYRAALKQADADAASKVEALEAGARDPNAAVVHDPERYRQIARVRMEQLTALVEQADALEAAYFEDLGALLTPEQAPRLAEAQRARRRASGGRFSMVCGEGVDLVRILDDLKIPRREGEVGEAVAQYEADADKLLEARQAMFRRVFKRATEMETRGDERDEKAMNEMITEMFEQGTRMRDANRRTARRIGSVLPDETRAAFEREVQERSFPKVYAASAAEKGLDAIAKFDDLTGDQRAQLSEIRAAYDREVTPLNDRWAAAVESAQSMIPGRFMEIMASEGEMPGIEPLKEACRARADLDERMRGRVQPLLTTEQRARMEELKIDKTDFEPDFMPDFDDDDAWDEWTAEDGEDKEGGG